MPAYVYRCNNCKNSLEVRQRFTDAPLRDCPVCGEPALRRVINQVGVVFKGSGFYVTDSRNSRNGHANGQSRNGHDSKDAESKEKTGAADTSGESKNTTNNNTTKETPKASTTSKTTTETAATP